MRPLAFRHEVPAESELRARRVNGATGRAGKQWKRSAKDAAPVSQKMKMLSMQAPLPGSAHGGAALLNPPTPGSGEWGGRETMSKTKPKRGNLLKSLKKEIRRGGAAVS